MYFWTPLYSKEQTNDFVVHRNIRFFVCSTYLFIFINMRRLLLLFFIATISGNVFSQELIKIDTVHQQDAPKYTYAYISIEGKVFSKRLKVKVDLGDTPEQIKAGNEYSNYLTNKKSYAAILNYMVENQFELVESLEYTDAYSVSGETSGIVFIMKKKLRDIK